MESSWSQLPRELLDMISHRLTSLADHVRFRAVCRSWASIGPPSRIPHQMPWLLQPHDEKTSIRTFVSISENKTYQFRSPEFIGKRCCGTSYGWLALADGAPQILLLNPLTNEKIPLPKLTELPEVLDFQERDQKYLLQDFSGFHHKEDIQFMRNNFICRVLLSGNPSLDRQDSWAAICYDLGVNRLAFCKLGDDSWTAIEDRRPEYIHFCFHYARLFSVDSTGRVMICNLRSPEKLTIIHLEGVSRYCRFYLVEFKGDLLMVKAPVEYSMEADSSDEEEDEFLYESGDTGDCGKGLPCLEYLNKAFWFIVFKLDEKEKRLVKVTNLGSHSLFLSSNCSMSLWASDIPSCRRNCIYFLDDLTVKKGRYRKRGYELCIINLKSGAVQPLLSLVFRIPRNGYVLQQDAWFMPSCSGNWSPSKSSQLAPEESHIWIPNVKGNSFMESTSLLDVHGKFAGAEPLNPSVYIAIMQTNLPESLQLLLLRVACGVLPTKMVARFQNPIPGSPCPLCHQAKESLDHLLLACRFTEVAWRNSIWPMHLPAVKHLSLAYWVSFITSPGLDLGLHGVEAKRFLCFAAIFIDQLWMLRNAVIFGHLPLDPLGFAFKLVRDYQWCLKFWDLRYINLLRGAKWLPPPVGQIKVSFDIAIRLEFAMLAMTCRDSEGRFVLASTERIPTCDLIMAEAKAAFLAISTAIKSGFTRIFVEGDDPAVIRPLQHWDRAPFEGISGVIADIRTLLASAESWCAEYVPVKANIATHNLACWAAFHNISGSIPTSSLPFCVVCADDRGGHLFSSSAQTRIRSRDLK